MINMPRLVNQIILVIVVALVLRAMANAKRRAAQARVWATAHDAR